MNGIWWNRKLKIAVVIVLVTSMILTGVLAVLSSGM